MVKLICKAYNKTDTIFFYNFFSIYQNVNRILSKKNKEKLSKNARKRYQNLSEEEKNIKRQYARERYRSPCEE